jgi:hypothetical protein
VHVKQKRLRKYVARNHRGKQNQGHIRSKAK